MSRDYCCAYCLAAYPVPSLARDCEARCGAELDEPGEGGAV